MFSFCFFSLKKSYTSNCHHWVKFIFVTSSTDSISCHIQFQLVELRACARCVKHSGCPQTTDTQTRIYCLSPNDNTQMESGLFLLEADSAEFNGKVVHDLKFGTTFESHWAASQPTSNYQQMLQALEHLCHLFFFCIC